MSSSGELSRVISAATSRRVRQNGINTTNCHAHFSRELNVAERRRQTSTQTHGMIYWAESSSAASLSKPEPSGRTQSSWNYQRITRKNESSVIYTLTHLVRWSFTVHKKTFLGLHRRTTVQRSPKQLKQMHKISPHSSPGVLEFVNWSKKISAPFFWCQNLWCSYKAAGAQARLRVGSVNTLQILRLTRTSCGSHFQYFSVSFKN